MKKIVKLDKAGRLKLNDFKDFLGDTLASVVEYSLHPNPDKSILIKFYDVKGKLIKIKER